MARILCGISGIEFLTQHMPLYNTARESKHPIFDVPSNKILGLTNRWIEQELTDTENYLLYLSLFNITGLMEFRVPAVMTADTPSIVANNMMQLIDIVSTILDNGEARAQQLFHLPTFVITPDTRDLESSKDWIKIWKQCYNDYCNAYRTATALEKLTRKETILERAIKDKTKDISAYAHQLASWASQAGRFPEYDAGLSKDILNGVRMSLSSYWQYIIKCCAKTEAIWDIPDADLSELIEHCEDNIEHGSIYAHTLMSLLRAGAERKKNYLDLGDIDIGSSGVTFRILDADTSIEDANKLAMIDTAPLNKPVEKDYPNKLAYIKAKMKWQMKMDYEQNQALAEKVAEINHNHSILQATKKALKDKAECSRSDSIEGDM